MMKKVMLSAILAITKAVTEPKYVPVGYAADGLYPVESSKISKDGETVNYQPNTNFKPCECDMNANSCDAYCCCDKFCDKTAINDWTEQRKCRNIEYPEDISNILPLSNCLS